MHSVQWHALHNMATLFNNHSCISSSKFSANWHATATSANIILLWTNCELCVIVQHCWVIMCLSLCLYSAVQEKLTTCQNSLDTVYENPAMKSVAYWLHAVLVHQGQASGGHYRAYVRKTSQTTCASTVDKLENMNRSVTETVVDREGPRVPSEGSTPPLESMLQSPSQSAEAAALTGRSSRKRRRKMKKCNKTHKLRTMSVINQHRLMGPKPARCLEHLM